MTRLQEVEKLLDTNLALITEYSKRVAELIGSVRALEKEREKLNENIQPVKHGHWKQIGTQFACSLCGAALKSNSFDRTTRVLIFNTVCKYCPNCGARMDGDPDA